MWTNNPHPEVSVRLSSTIAAFALATTLCAAQPARKEVIGYFPAWKWKPVNGVMTVAAIPFDKLTIINYAFWYPMPDGHIAAWDSAGDAVYLRGPKESRLVDRAHDHGVKVMLSLGGWDGSDNFPAAASTAQSRTAFSASCLDIIRQYGFDGIDIDWEYPGFAEHKGTSADRVNFPLLLRSLRDSLNAEAARTGKGLLLTAAFPATRAQLSGIDMQAVEPLLDQINLMTYDYHGTWETVSGHNSPLYASRPEDSLLCLSASYRLFTEELAVPPSKVNLGVPFYGHAYRGCAGLHQTASGPDTTFLRPDESFASALARAAGSFTRYRDEKAGVPYLVSTDGTTFVTYDDERSIGLKAAFVRDHNARGLIIWEITQDLLPDGSTRLLDAIDAVFRPGLPTHK
jgi:chitinase